MAKKYTLDVPTVLQQENAKLTGINEDGTYKVETPDGEGTWDPKEYIKSQGHNPDEFDIEANTPDTALDSSPLSENERIKLAGLSNEKGKINYLRAKYKDQVQLTDNGLAVNNQGVWQQVDPSAFGGDQWDLTKEVIGAGLVGGATGFMLGGPPGAVAGAALAGGATLAEGKLARNKPLPSLTDMDKAGKEATIDSEEFLAEYGPGMMAAAKGARLGSPAGPWGMAAGALTAAGLWATGKTLMGKHMGLWQGTDKELAKDIALETFNSAAGFVIPPGAKAIGSGIGALRTFGKAEQALAKTASPEAYGILKNMAVSGMRQVIPGGSIPVAQNVVERASIISPKSDLLFKMSPVQAEATAGQKVAQNLRIVVKDARQTLGKDYSTARKAIIANSDDFKVDWNQSSNNVAQSLNERGMIQTPGANAGYTTNVVDPSVVTNSGNKVSDMVGKSTNLNKLTLEEVAPAIGGVTINPAQQAGVHNFIREMDRRMVAIGKAEGKDAADQTLTLYKDMNRALNKLREGKEGLTKYQMREIRAVYSQEFQNILHQNGKLQMFDKMNKGYANRLELVEDAEDALIGASPGAEDAYINSLFRHPGGARARAFGELDAVGLSSKRGNIAAQEALDWQSAKATREIFPRFSFQQPASLVVSPAMARKGMVYTQRGLSMLRTLDKGTRQQLLQHPEALGAVLQQMDASFQTQTEDSVTQGLLQDALGGGQSGQ